MGSNQEKNWRSKISWHTPFNIIMRNQPKKVEKKLSYCNSNIKDLVIQNWPRGLIPVHVVWESWPRGLALIPVLVIWDSWPRGLIPVLVISGSWPRGLIPVLVKWYSGTLDHVAWSHFLISGVHDHVSCTQVHTLYLLTDSVVIWP